MELQPNQTLQDILKSDTIFYLFIYLFYQKNYLMTFKTKIFSFMITVNPKNGNKTKSDIFP